MKKYHGIQVLRFIAASLVILEHLIGDVLSGWKSANQLSIPVFGSVGVCVFFAISGFIMVTTQHQSFGSKDKALEFFVRRLIRVLPIYAIATVLQFINKFNFSVDYTFVNLFKSLLFIPYENMSGDYRPVLAQGWTLNFEMFFYLVFAASLVFSRMRGLLLAIIVFLTLAVFHDQAKELNAFWEFYANRILLFFVCGMLVALVKLKYPVSTDKFVPVLLVCLALISLASVLNLFVGRLAQFSLTLSIAFVCVYLAASYEAKSYGKVILFFERLGDASYSTYLFHTFLLGAVKFLSHRVGDQQYVALVALAISCVILANAIGMAAFRFAERPIAVRLKDLGKVKSFAARTET